MSPNPIAAEAARQIEDIAETNLQSDIEAIIQAAIEKAMGEGHSFMLTEVKRVADDRDYWREQAQSRAAHASEQSADTKRLDWLSENLGYVMLHGPPQKQLHTGLGTNLREAIDAAMSQKEKE